MAKRTIALIACFILVVVVLIGTKNAVNKKENKSLPAITGSPTVSASAMNLSLVPNFINTQAGKSVAMDIVLDTQGTRPSLIQIELAYDPLTLSGIDILQGDLTQQATVSLKTINQQTGRISYGLQLPEQKLTATKGSVAKISFRTHENPRTSSTNIYFLPKTSVQTIGGLNSLGAAYGGTITISASNSADKGNALPGR